MERSKKVGCVAAAVAAMALAVAIVRPGTRSTTPVDIGDTQATVDTGYYDTLAKVTPPEPATEVVQVQLPKRPAIMDTPGCHFGNDEVLAYLQELKDMQDATAQRVWDNTFNAMKIVCGNEDAADNDEIDANLEAIELTRSIIVEALEAQGCKVTLDPERLIAVDFQCSETDEDLANDLTEDLDDDLAEELGEEDALIKVLQDAFSTKKTALVLGARDDAEGYTVYNGHYNGPVTADSPEELANQMLDLIFADIL